MKKYIASLLLFFSGWVLFVASETERRLHAPPTTQPALDWDELQPIPLKQWPDTIKRDIHVPDINGDDPEISQV